MQQDCSCKRLGNWIFHSNCGCDVEQREEVEVVVEEEEEDGEVGAASEVWGEEVDFDLEFISELVPREGIFFALGVETL